MDNLKYYDKNTNHNYKNLDTKKRIKYTMIIIYFKQESSINICLL